MNSSLGQSLFLKSLIALSMVIPCQNRLRAFGQETHQQKKPLACSSTETEKLHKNILQMLEEKDGDHEFRKKMAEFIVRFLVKPGVLKGILEIVEKRDLLEAEKKEKATIKKMAQKLTAKMKELKDITGAILGNPKAKKNVFVFVNPFCGHCHHAITELAEFTKTNKDYQFSLIYVGDNDKEFRYHSGAVMVAYAMHKMDAFLKVMAERFSPAELADFKKIADKIKVDPKVFMDQLESKSIDQKLDRSKKLATDIGLRGTPTFFYQGNVVGGYSSVQQLLKDLEKNPQEKALIHPFAPSKA
jgi:protein-disulfide isomerase